MFRCQQAASRGWPESAPATARYSIYEIHQASVVIACADAQFIISPHKRRHARLAGAKSAIGVDAHVIAALAGYKSIVNPVADGISRSGNRPKATTSRDIAKIPIGDADIGRRTTVIKMGIQAIITVVRIQYESRLSCCHSCVSPEFNGDFVGGNDGAEVGHRDVLVDTIENQRVAKRVVGGRSDFDSSNIRISTKRSRVTALVNSQSGRATCVNGGRAGQRRHSFRWSAVIAERRK